MHRAIAIRTLAAIGLLAATRGPVLSQARSAEEVFARFCALDSQGGQFTPDGWQKIAALFVSPGTPRRDRIFVTDRPGQLRPTPEGEKIGVGREYIRLGRIDLPQVRFSAEAPGAKIVEMGLYVVKVVGPSGVVEWRIEGTVPIPLLTVDAAIRYVTETRANAKDATIRQNADRTLAALKHLR